MDKEKGILSELTPEQHLVNQHLQRLDEVSRKMEAKWGVERLPKCVSEELAAKWGRQWEKLNVAIAESKYLEVVDLAQGCVRAWEALERAAMGSGYQPDIGAAFECRMPSGGVLRVCSSPIDARRPVPEGYIVYSMEEVARVLDAQQLINVLEKNKSEPSKEIKELPPEFWKGGGEVLGF